MLRSGPLSLGVLVQSWLGMFKLYILFFSYLNVTEFSKFLRMKISPLLLWGAMLILYLLQRLFPLYSRQRLFSRIFCPQGSSHATGGILCGHAAATYYSLADSKNIMLNIIGTTKLTAKIYMSNLDPLNLNHDNMAPSSKVTIKMSPSLGPILDNVSKHYPAIKDIFWFEYIICFLIIN